jgi:hypothetical protein
MPLTTYNLSISVQDESGSAVANAIVTAELVSVQGRPTSDFNVEGGFFPVGIETTTDVNGDATLALVPNSSGTTNSRYRIVIKDENRKQLSSHIIQMPEANSNLSGLVTATDVDVAALVAG